jgi:hypothetical protein
VASRSPLCSVLRKRHFTHVDELRRIPNFAAIINADDTHTSERAYIENHFSDHETYLDPSEHWESLYQGTFESNSVRSDYQSDTGSFSTIETGRQSAYPTVYIQSNVPDIPTSLK